MPISRALGAIAFAFVFAASAAGRADAIPIFAQRYALSCATCHTALPELNTFGNAFRNRGYRLPSAVPRHGTTIAAIRYNLGYEREPAAGTRRFAPTASIVADADIGAVNAYLHYNLGAGGAPGAPYLGFLSTYGTRSRTLYRAGLFELPLPQSPGQRLDEASSYGYLGTTVGQNDLTLAAPRLGLEAEREVGRARVAATLAFGEFKGAAYGGRPVFTGTTTVAARPELGIYGRIPIGRSGVTLDASLLDGRRRIALPGRAPFSDPYRRAAFGLDVRTAHERLDVTLEQWLGRDDNDDGAGHTLGSSGGYARIKYFVTPHAYAALRYDAAANPFAARTLVAYIGALVGRHARVILERRTNVLDGRPSFGGSVTIAAPWPRGY